MVAFTNITTSSDYIYSMGSVNIRSVPPHRCSLQPKCLAQPVVISRFVRRRSHQQLPLRGEAPGAADQKIFTRHSPQSPALPGSSALQGQNADTGPPGDGDGESMGNVCGISAAGIPARKHRRRPESARRRASSFAGQDSMPAGLTARGGEVPSGTASGSPGPRA